MDKKNRICLSAIEIISKEGFANSKISTIVEFAGLSVGTFYNYFKDKNDVLCYIYIQEISRQCNILDTLISSELPARDKIEGYIDFIIKESLTELNLVTLIQNEKSTLRRLIDNTESDKVYSTFLCLESYFSDLIDEGEKAGIVQATSKTFLLSMIQSLLDDVVRERNLDIHTTSSSDLKSFISSLIFIETEV